MYFLKSNKPKLKKENNKELVSGLLRCQSIKPKCKIIYNRYIFNR